jgi:hypothetical protein
LNRIADIWNYDIAGQTLAERLVAAIDDVHSPTLFMNENAFTEP